VFRDEWAGLLATLIRQVGDFQLAEDALQDAFAAAVTAWRRDGVPDNVGAWITVTARRRAIDRLRRDRSLADRVERLAELVRLDGQEHPSESEVSVLDDDRLRLIFTCCHPALDLPARVALTQRTVGGLTTGEIARAFLNPRQLRTWVEPPSPRSPQCGSVRPGRLPFRPDSARLRCRAPSVRPRGEREAGTGDIPGVISRGWARPEIAGQPIDRSFCGARRRVGIALNSAT
jgi:RNA polymerase sigma factor (sigma-70 family)